MTPQALSNFVSAHFAGSGFKMSNKRKRKNPMIYTHQASRFAYNRLATNRKVINCPTTSSITIIDGSCSVYFNTSLDAIIPIMKVTNVKTNIPIVPKKNATKKANGKVANEPAVPDANGKYPAPNQEHIV